MVMVSEESVPECPPVSKTVRASRAFQREAAFESFPSAELRRACQAAPGEPLPERARILRLWRIDFPDPSPERERESLPVAPARPRWGWPLRAGAACATREGA